MHVEFWISGSLTAVFQTEKWETRIKDPSAISYRPLWAFLAALLSAMTNLAQNTWAAVWLKFSGCALFSFSTQVIILLCFLEKLVFLMLKRHNIRFHLVCEVKTKIYLLFMMLLLFISLMHVVIIKLALFHTAVEKAEWNHKISRLTPDIWLPHHALLLHTLTHTQTHIWCMGILSCILSCRDIWSSFYSVSKTWAFYSQLNSVWVS